MNRHFPITRLQREALFRVFQRDFPGWISPGRRHEGPHPCPHCGLGGSQPIKVPTVQWRIFRNKVMPMFGCDGAVCIHWQGMWLAIEKDGYTHS